jgi:hypothetical protein
MTSRARCRVRRSNSTEAIFTDIYKLNAWGGEDSVSGPGSDADQTSVITRELPELFGAIKVSTILDIPCGDFHWMKTVDLTNIDYTGADVVHDLVKKNRARYARDGVRFERLDLLEDELPTVDLILCRDCLVHLSFADIASALGNICRSQSEYCLTTTFVDRQDNDDIETGEWRAINLELAPFVLPKPLKVIHEGCTEQEGAYRDKTLALWRIADIRGTLRGVARDRGVAGLRSGA